MSDASSDASKEVLSVGKRGATYIFGYGMLHVMGLISLPILTRIITPAQYGILTLCTIFSSFLLYIYRFGMLDTIQKYYHEYDKKEWSVFWSSIVFSMCIIAVIGTVLLFSVGKSLIRTMVPGVSFYPYLFITVITSFCMAFFELTIRLFQIKEKSAVFVKLHLSRAIIRIAALVIFAVLLVDNLLAAFLSIAAAALFGFIVFLYSSRGLLKLKFDLKMASTAARFGSPVFLNDIAFMFLFRIDTIILANYTNVETVGIYALSATIASIVNDINIGLNDAWTPFFFRSVKKEGVDTSGIISKMSTYFVFVSWFINFGLAIFGYEVLHFVAGKAFDCPPAIVAGLTLAMMIGALQFRSVNQIYYAKRTEIVTISTCIVAGISLISNYFLIPVFGMAGAVFSIIVIRAIYSGILYFFARKLFPVDIDWLRIFILFILIVVLLALSVVIQGMFGFWTVILIKLLLVILLPTILYFSGFFKKQEKQMAMQLIRTKYEALVKRIK